jgi:hypothetical protein
LIDLDDAMSKDLQKIKITQQVQPNTTKSNQQNQNISFETANAAYKKYQELNARQKQLREESYKERDYKLANAKTDVAASLEQEKQDMLNLFRKYNEANNKAMNEVEGKALREAVLRGEK